jgi:hypothetical protein
VLEALNHQGKFGEDYVRALASAAGLLTYDFDLDHDGIDLGIRFPGRVNGVGSPGVEVQIKSSSQRAIRPKDGEWRFGGLNEVQFNRLAGDDFTVPRFLIFVRVPPVSEDYVGFRTEGMLFRHLAYYCTLRDELPIERPDRNRKRSVRVPTANVLTPRSLLNLVCSVPVAARSLA